MDDFDASPTGDDAAPGTGDDDFWGDEPPAPTPPGSDAEGVRRRRSWRTWLVAGVGAAAIGGAAVIGIGAASSDNSLASAAAGSNSSGAPGGFNGSSNGAAPSGANGQGRPGAFGTISAIDGSTLTVKDMSRQSVKVVTTSSTTVTKTATVDLSDVKVGDHVVVEGSGSSSNIAATQVHDDGAADDSSGNQQLGGPGGPAGTGTNSATATGAFVTGTVTSVDGSTLNVKDANGDSVTVAISSSTKITKDETVDVAALAVGDDVMVSGTASNGTITATRIRDGVEAGAGPLGGGPAGGGGTGPGTGSSGNGQPPSGSPQSA
jgi:hypothetical protein